MSLGAAFNTALDGDTIYLAAVKSASIEALSLYQGNAFNSTASAARVAAFSVARVIEAMLPITGAEFAMLVEVLSDAAGLYAVDMAFGGTRSLVAYLTDAAVAHLGVAAFQSVKGISY